MVQQQINGLKILPALFMLVLFCSCNNEITIEGFSKENWKKDSLGCKEMRKNISDILCANGNKIIDSNYDQILDFLGQPNSISQFEDKVVYKYYTENGVQCGAEITTNQDTFEVASILIVFDKSKVVNVECIIP